MWTFSLNKPLLPVFICVLLFQLFARGYYLHHILWEAEHNGRLGCCVAEGIAGQPSVQAAAWRLMAALSEFYSQNQEEERAEQKEHARHQIYLSKTHAG